MPYVLRWLPRAATESTSLGARVSALDVKLAASCHSTDFLQSWVKEEGECVKEGEGGGWEAVSSVAFLDGIVAKIAPNELFTLAEFGVSVTTINTCDFFGDAFSVQMCSMVVEVIVQICRGRHEKKHGFGPQFLQFLSLAETA